MAQTRQIILLNPDASGSMQPMGRKQEILSKLEAYNIGLSLAHKPTQTHTKKSPDACSLPAP